MKSKKCINERSVSISLTVFSILAITSGCSKEPATQAPLSQAPQGELIQGNPIDPTDTNPDLEIKEDAQWVTEEASTPTQTNPELNTSTEVVFETVYKSTPNASKQSELAVIQTASQPEVLAKIVLEEVALIDKKYLPVSFEKLASFEYEMPEDLTEPVAGEDGHVYKEQIPETIKSLNDQPIALKGFMLPLKVEKGLVTEMLIMRDQSMCCYGTVPKINEWVSVRMDELGVKPIMDEPVTILGNLKVGEVLENGYLVGIYEMEGQSMIAETYAN